MRNRAWVVFFAATLFFTAMQRLVAETAQDRAFVGNLVMLFATLTIVFVAFDMSGRRKP